MNITEMKVEVNVDQITGMRELIEAADEFVTRCQAGEIRSKHSYGKFAAALDKIGQADLSTTLHVTKPNEFYQLDGKPEAPNMDDEIAQGFAAALKGLKFIHEGPAVKVDKAMMDSMYTAYVAKAIPKLEALVENRIAPKYSFSQLVDLGFTTYANCQGEAPLEQMKAACRRIKLENSSIFDLLDTYKPGDNIGTDVLINLAQMAIATQLIMNTFGFTQDDVQLKSRQLLGMSESTKPSVVPESHN